MPPLSLEQIQTVFDELGLGTEAQRNRLRALAEPVPFGTETYCPIRLDIGSSPTLPEDRNA